MPASTPLFAYGVTADTGKNLVAGIHMPYGLTTPAGLEIIGGAYPDPVTVPTGQTVITIGMEEIPEGSGTYHLIAWASDAVDLPDSPENYPYTAEVKQCADALDMTVYADVAIEWATSSLVRAQRQIPETWQGGMLVGGVWGGAVGNTADAVREKFRDDPLPTYQVQRDPNP